MKVVNTKELIKDLGFPEKTEFLGYSIHLEESDEYLLDYQLSSEVNHLTWTTRPEMAKHFQSFKKVEKTRDKIKPTAIIMWIFDTGTHIFATQPEDYN
jgi:hypothetical protein